MELRHLRYFLAVAEHLNFGRAADALHTAQPALSQQILKLERELGGALFERTKRHVALTPLGSELLGEAQGIVEAADRLAVRGRDASGMPRGRLRVGSIVPATIGVIPSAAASYRAAFPLVEFSVETVGLDEQVRALLERRIDVGILRGPVDDDRIVTIPIVTEFLVLAVPSAHRLAAQPSAHYSELDGEPFIELQADRAGSFDARVQQALRTHGVRLGRVVQSSSVETVFALVASGAGVTIVSSVILAFQFAGLAYRPLIPREQITTMIIAARRDRRTVPTVSSFIDHVLAMNLQFDPPAAVRSTV